MYYYERTEKIRRNAPERGSDMEVIINIFLLVVWAWLGYNIGYSRAMENAHKIAMDTLDTPEPEEGGRNERSS